MFSALRRGRGHASRGLATFAPAGPSAEAATLAPLRALAAWLAPAHAPLAPPPPALPLPTLALPLAWSLGRALTAFSLLPELNFPALLLTGKGKYTGKNKRYPKKANHGARPTSHIGRQQRRKADGNFKARMKS